MAKKRCKNLGCGMAIPLKWLSPREYCADCEHEEYLEAAKDYRYMVLILRRIQDLTNERSIRNIKSEDIAPKNTKPKLVE